MAKQSGNTGCLGCIIQLFVWIIVIGFMMYIGIAIAGIACVIGAIYGIFKLMKWIIYKHHIKNKENADNMDSKEEVLDIEAKNVPNPKEKSNGLECNGQTEYVKTNTQKDSQNLPVLNRVDMYNNKIDYMTGEDFELYVAQMLGKIGFYNIQTTKGSGDQGVDILAEKEGMKYAFQCKRYDKPVGNKAVQEVFAGKFFYHCHVAVVVTNNYFTQSAKDLAHENGVVLWDRDYVQKLIGATNEVPTEKDILREYNENREDGELRLLDIEEKIVAIEDGELSKYLYQFIEQASRIAIDMYLENGDGNPYTEDMIANAEKPIFLYNVKCHKLMKYVLNFTYYCEMNTNFKNTSAYNKLLELSKENNRKFEDNLFKIDVFYNVCDIIFERSEVKIEKVPEVNIDTDTLDEIKLLEDIDEWETESGGKCLVTESFFPMKLDNMKFK